MSNRYQETDIIGKSYLGTDRIIFETPLDGDGMVTFVESKRVNLEDNTVISKHNREIQEHLISFGDESNIDEVFELYNAFSGAGLGEQMTYGDVANVLYSIYIHVASKQDKT